MCFDLGFGLRDDGDEGFFSKLAAGPALDLAPVAGLEFAFRFGFGLSVARMGGFSSSFIIAPPPPLPPLWPPPPRLYIFCGYFSGFPHRGLLLCRTSSSQLWRRWRQLLLPGLVVLFVHPPIVTAVAVDAPLRVNQ